MEKVKIFQKEIKIGEFGYVNKNCWLVKNLNYPPSKRCQYCESKFSNCLFFRYLIITLVLILFIFIASFLIKENISRLVIISIFVLVIIYGYFFSKSTEDIIVANFAERKAKEALKELNINLQQKVQEQTKDITQLSEIKSEFLRIVNHQLRTPVSIIKSMLSMMIEGTIKGKTKQEEAIGKLYLSSERLNNILNDLLNAQDLVGEPLVPNLAPTQIEDIIGQAIKDLSISAKRKKLNIIFNQPKEKTPIILLDGILIETAFKKLIDNAVLYTEKGKITVNLTENKNNLQITVKDTGAGIPKEDQPRLFKIFSRGKSAEKIHPNGSGLGLFIAKEYIEAHRGTIEIQSEENKGTVVLVTLPIIT